MCPTDTHTNHDTAVTIDCILVCAWWCRLNRNCNTHAYQFHRHCRAWLAPSLLHFQAEMSLKATKSGRPQVLVFYVTPPPVGKRGVLWWACLCVCLWTSLRNLHQIFYACYLCMHVLLWRDIMYISSFLDDVIFAHKLTGCSMSLPGWGSEAHTYTAFTLTHRNTRCRQRTFGTTSCSQWACWIFMTSCFMT